MGLLAMCPFLDIYSYKCSDIDSTFLMIFTQADLRVIQKVLIYY